MTAFDRTLVTAALPYANGPIHLGHLAGVYVPADIYVRFLRSQGENVLFICGSDEHGVPITIAAEKEGISPKELVDRNYPMIRDSFAALGVVFDNYSQTSREIHHQTSSDFFLDLHASGVLEQGSSMQYYSEENDRFYPDRYVHGTCPNCQNDRARGDQCEKCGSQIEPDELIDPFSARDGATITLKETTHWFLPLGKLQDWLQPWIEGHPEWRENVLNYCRGWFETGLGNRAVTRDLSWGVPVPLPGHEGKVLYVWFDAPIGYISATREWATAPGDPEAWRTWWQDAVDAAGALHRQGQHRLPRDPVPRDAARAQRGLRHRRQRAGQRVPEPRGQQAVDEPWPRGVAARLPGEVPAGLACATASRATCPRRATPTSPGATSRPGTTTSSPTHSGTSSTAP